MTTANLTGTLTLTRDERDVLRHLIAIRLDGDTIQLDTRDSAPDALERREELEGCFAILDQLGWERDEPGDSFDVVTDKTLRCVLKRELDASSAYVSETALAWRRCRDREDGMLGPDETWDEVDVRAESEMNSALDELQALSRISRRLWWKDRGEDRV